MGFENITPKEAFEKMKEGFVYLDVRTEEEFKEGHAKGAINIPIFVMGVAGRAMNPDFINEVKKQFPTETKLVIGCRSGGRSAKACELLGAQGYTVLFNIDGGFVGRPDPVGGWAQPGWQACGLPCE